MTPFQRSDSQSGMSLVAVMVGFALIGIFATVFSSAMKNAIDAQNMLNARLEFDSIGRHIIGLMDCEVSFPSSTPVGWVAIKDRSTPPLTLVKKFVSPNGTKFRNYEVRARIKACGTCPNGKTLEMEAREKNGLWKDINHGIPSYCKIP